MLAKIVATFFGIGYIQKGAGTIAALFCCLLWYFLKIGTSQFWVEGLILIVVFMVGVLASHLVEKSWGHDSNKIVIDEVLGMLVSLLLVPTEWPYVLAAFILFRFFDIAKPLFIRRVEKLPGGWGVMMDDLLAGTYTCLILQLMIKMQLF